MNRLKIYLDTSVISFLFATDAPQFTEITKEFFENYSDQYDLYISDIVLLEISKNRNTELMNKMLDVTEKYGIKKLESTNEINTLAKVYIDSGIIPVKKVEDALHVGYSTFYDIDILLSWNFRHLANVNKEHLIIIENLKIGYYYPLRLLSPLEVINEITD